MVEVHAHGAVAVAAEVVEAVGAEKEGDERDVAGVHGLEGEAGGGAIEVGIGDQLPDCFQHLLQEAALNQPQLQHLLLLQAMSLAEDRGVPFPGGEGCE